MKDDRVKTMATEAKPQGASPEAIAELYRGGLSIARISAATGIGGNRVYGLLRRSGVPMRGRNERPPFPLEKLRIPPEAMAELYRDGASLETVALKAGVRVSRARGILCGIGVAIRQRPVKTEPLLPPKTIARRYRAGKSAGELATEAGVSVEDIRDILVGLGEELRPPLGNQHGRLDSVWLTPKKLVQLYKEGESVKSLAEMLGVSREMIRTLLLKRGVKLRGRAGQRSPEPKELVADPEAVARRYQAGEGMLKIAAELGSTEWKVRTALLKLGVKLRDRAGARCLSRPSSDTAKRVAALYRGGMGTEGIALATGLGRKIVRRMLKEQMVAMRGTGEGVRQPPDLRKLPDAEVARRYAAGGKLQDVATAAGTTAAVVRRILAEQGVPLRPKTAQFKIPKEKIGPLYRAGKSLAKIAAMAGCSQEAIRRILRKDGVAMREKTELNRMRAARLQLSEEEIEAGYREGGSLSQIAAAAGVSLTRVADILRRRGVSLRGRGATSLPDTANVRIPPEKMEELYLAGSTLVQIAAMAGSNRKRVADILKRRGVEIRSRR